LVAFGPDVILAPGSVTLGPLLQITRSIPIVFVHVPDPVGAGFIDSLARPGGNATGFALYEFDTSAKWLEILKQIAPSARRVAVLLHPDTSVGLGQWGAIHTAAPSLGFSATPLNVRDAGEIERAINRFAQAPHGGLIVTGSVVALQNRDLIISLASRHKLPAVYWDRALATAGGLISFGSDLRDQHRLAAGYVDRILRGEKPADLPVQQPTKYELVINLKTAKALGLTVPPALLATADEVIE
jgi:putative ABC transport system substrate-binding protein